MSADVSKADGWDYQVESTLPNSETLSFRTRVTHQGVFDEAEMHLVWQRANKAPLVYLVGSGHAGYEKVVLRVRDDGQAVWFVARKQGAQRWQAIASLDLVSGEFHAEGDFVFPPPKPAWATIDERDGLLMEKQLTWMQDNETGIQRLFDGDRGLFWEWSEQEGWILKSGSLEEVDFPLPASPYRMEAPDWAKALPENQVNN